MKNKEVKNWNFLLGLILSIVILLPLCSAGVGISWSKESSLVRENTKTCLTYKVYNPWPDDSYAQIKLSDELMQIMTSRGSETEFIPHDTSSSMAIPVEFCFKTPKVYEKNCWLFGELICKKECKEEMKIFDGEVEVIEVDSPETVEGSGGSATKMSVSAPIRVKVQCIAHSRDYSVIYIAVILIAGILLTINLTRKRNKKQ